MKEKRRTKARFNPLKSRRTAAVTPVEGEMYHESSDMNLLGDIPSIIDSIHVDQSADRQLIGLASIHNFLHKNQAENIDENLLALMKSGLLDTLLKNIGFSPLSGANVNSMSSSQDIVLESLRVLLALIQSRPEYLRQIANFRDFTSYICEIALGMNLEIFGEYLCDILILLACDSEKAFEQISRSAFIKELPSRTISLLLNGCNASNMLLSASELIMVMSEGNRYALKWFPQDVVANLNMALTTDNIGLKLSVTLACVSFNLLLLVDMQASDEDSIQSSLFLGGLKSIERVISANTVDMFALEVISRAAFVAGRFIDGDGDLQNDDADFELEEQKMLDEDANIAESLEQDVEMTSSDVHLTSNGNITNAEKSIGHIFAKWIYQENICEKLVSTIMDEFNSSSISLTISAINTLSDVISNFPEAFIRKDIDKFQRLFSEQLWLKLRDISSKATMNTISLMESIALFAATSGLMWALSRVICKCATSPIGFFYDHFFSQEWLPLYQSLLQPANVESEAQSLFRKLLLVSRVNMCGILAAYAQNQSLNADIVQQMTEFLVDRLTGQTNFGQHETSPAVMTELINAFMDLHGQDQYDNEYRKLPVKVVDTIVNTARNKSKAIDPRGKNKEIPAVPSKYSWINDCLLLQRNESIIIEGRDVRDRLWDMYVNLIRFRQYKSSLLITKNR